jgi:hypothetical protein
MSDARRSELSAVLTIICAELDAEMSLDEHEWLIELAMQYEALPDGPVKEVIAVMLSEPISETVQ